ncbi:MAG: DUF1273 family protein [Clostridia bacterium]|nr:DUF1273 family protein [Clostridia bacterium]
MDRSKACCFTGHRDIGPDFNKDLLSRGVSYLINRGVDTFIVGGALGFDTLVAQAVLEAKRENPNIKLWVFTPCQNQDASWSPSDKKIYKDILSRADYVDMPNTGYYAGCMKDRNYKMVDNASFCICYYDGTFKSGTGQTYRYAQKCGLTIYNLYNR